ncbi:Bud-site selection protein [Biscogniauxia mediterranea]|nr:Bud-site selection protein [Biscogniauxia mediterranea]
MPKRKRGEPSLDEKLAQWRKELVRGLKTAKGFERQRLSKRIREADAEKTARLEREVAVLKSLDLHQAANAHLCSSLLKIKGVAESPKLPADVKPVAKPTGLTDEEKAALHNVTSALCNRKQVKDVIEEAVMGTCIALRVPMPEKGKGKAKGKDLEKRDDQDAENTTKDKKKKTGSRGGRAEKEEQADDRDGISVGGTKDQDLDEEDTGFDEPILLKRQLEGDYDGLESAGEGSDASESPEFNGFSDSDAEERAFARYDDFVGGSSSSDEGEEESDDEDASDEDDLVDSRTKSIRKLALDDISLSSGGSGSNQSADESSDSEDDAISPPPKKARSSSSKDTRSGTSAFLPSLMGGYISGSESASDVDVAPARKNRRGQRARQAIWEKKYGDKAKHHQKKATEDSRNQGWDMKRGAVGGDDNDGSGGSKPWKKGIQNPFEKQHVHPQRQQRMNQPDKDKVAKEPNRQQRRQESGQSKSQQPPPSLPKPKPIPNKRDDTGPLHPSWAAAKKAKEEATKVAFQGRKVTFD